MNLSKDNVKKQIKNNSSKGKKVGNKFALLFFKSLFVIFLILAIFGAAMGIGMYKGVIDNTPEMNIASIVPMGYATNVYDSKGNLTDTLVMAGSNREECTYDELPQDLIDAFVAYEDARFWQHKGIDLRAILRSIRGVLEGDTSSGGGSTITQQLIKNNVFNGGRENSFGATIERKLQEQVLAVELEKRMDKKVILTNYLNTINLGNNTLGVKVAAKRYFNKEVSELTLSECSVIAGITQNPSKFNPISGAEKNEEKRKVILRYMYEQGYITKEERENALADDVYERIQNVDMVSQQSVNNSFSYFTDELINNVMEIMTEELGYTATQAYNLLYSGGLSIYTTQNPDIQAIVDKEVNDPENYISSRYSISYKLSVFDNGKTSNYSEKTLKNWYKEVLNKPYKALYDTEDEARAVCDEYKEYVLSQHSKDAKVTGERFNPILQPQTSFSIIEQSTGKVVALSGGRGKKEGSLTLNRATDTTRQPGSTFKVLSAFAPAIDTCGSSLATVYYDEPYTLGNKTFKNWYSTGYMGWSNIRDGIIYSMNIVAVRCIAETVSPQLGVDYCRKFGITSLTENDYNAATALGGVTYGVSNLELTAAYATIANEGVYTKPIMFTKILDHSGKIIYESKPHTSRVLKDTSAFLLTDAMKGSMEYNHMYSRPGVSLTATSTAAHLDAMSCAGKSGTTTNNYDIWFVGFTPYYTAAIWAGFDENESTLDGQTSFHKTIWKKIMDQVHEGLPDPGFNMPEDIIAVDVCHKSGKLAIEGICDCDPRGSAVYTEYFEKGTEPTEMCDHHTTVNLCTESIMAATEYCPSITPCVTVIVPEAVSPVINNTGIDQPIELSETVNYTETPAFYNETDDTLSVNLNPCNIHGLDSVHNVPVNNINAPYITNGPVSSGYYGNGYGPGYTPSSPGQNNSPDTIVPNPSLTFPMNW